MTPVGGDCHRRYYSALVALEAPAAASFPLNSTIPRAASGSGGWDSPKPLSVADDPYRVVSDFGASVPGIEDELCTWDVEPNPSEPGQSSSAEMSCG
jgi:hypothetical protein